MEIVCPSESKQPPRVLITLIGIAVPSSFPMTSITHPLLASPCIPRSGFFVKATIFVVSFSFFEMEKGKREERTWKEGVGGEEGKKASVSIGNYKLTVDV